MSGRRRPAAGGASRGMALVQALVLVAALAAVAAALLIRADGARTRLQLLVQADQAALHLSSGVAQVQALLSDPALATVTHRGQPWARERSGIRLHDAQLSWRIDDLQARFDVNLLSGPEERRAAARAVFARLARGQGLSDAATARLADALSGGADLPLPLAHPAQLLPLVDTESEAFVRLLPLLAALPAPAPLNINTARPEVLRALAPGLSAARATELHRRLRQSPARSLDAFAAWAEEMLGAETLAALGALGLGTRSDSFEATLSAQLDSLRLGRSVVLSRSGAQGRFRILLSLPEFD